MLGALSGLNNKNERRALTLLLTDVSQQLSYDFQKNCHGLNETRLRAEAQISFVLAMRTLWSITPQRLFTSADPNFERLAKEALAHIDTTPDPSATLALSQVFRHLRRAEKRGRRDVTSLNFENPSHRSLLKEQGGRCALCRYRFEDHELDYADVDDAIFGASRQNLVDEEALSTYSRRPTLDHIIPHFLGGDSPGNWQILCTACNAGKGEGLAWVIRRGLLSATRPSDALQLTPSLRHAVLANYHATASSVTEGGELRIFRRDRQRLPVFDNLEVRVDA